MSLLEAPLYADFVVGVLGASVRVGLEDDFYLPDGAMARSNGELVAAARALVDGAGRRPATAAEARGLLGLLGLPPPSPREGPATVVLSFPVD
jgi:3-keto-5-aminohexanoate cleavage enzyme